MTYNVGISKSLKKIQTTLTTFFHDLANYKKSVVEAAANVQVSPIRAIGPIN